MSERSDLWRAWTWLPTLYFAQGLPYTLANITSVVLFKALGVANGPIAFWTSWLALIWAFKALWSPLVDGLGTRRRWVVGAQLAFVPATAVVALAVGTPWFFTLALLGLFLLALASATHDIAADGLYMLGLSETAQAGFVGLRTTFWRLGFMFGEGALVALAGYLGVVLADKAAGWRATLLVAVGVFALLALYNALLLPRPAGDQPREAGTLGHSTVEMVRSFFARRGIVLALLFILFFRFSENHMSKLVSPFLLDPVAVGGMGWGELEVGVAKGTFGVIALVVGGLLGGVALARWGLRPMLLPMVLAVNAPNLLYWGLAVAQPDSFAAGAAVIAVEQFGYGFGLCAYMMFFIELAKGEFKTAHYAFATGLMALSVWMAQFWSGWMQEALGYEAFFLWVSVLALPGVIVALWARRQMGRGELF